MKKLLKGPRRGPQRAPRKAHSLTIPSWPEIEKALALLAEGITGGDEYECPIYQALVESIYLEGFKHGLLNGLVRGKNPRARKIPYTDERDRPLPSLCEKIALFAQRMDALGAKTKPDTAVN